MIVGSWGDEEEKEEEEETWRQFGARDALIIDRQHSRAGWVGDWRRRRRPGTGGKAIQ